MAKDVTEVQAGLWAVADHLRANSPLASHEHSEPVLGLIFLKYATLRLHAAETELA